MKPNVAKAGMVRLGASLLGVLALAGAALAGDRALVDIIGYSQDARYFAFEEFGIQDGSGFAYSSIYIVDLKTDSWVVGTPVREQADDEAVSLSQIRAEVQLQAAEEIRGFGIEWPAEYAALLGDGAPGSDGRTLSFGSPGYNPGDVSGNYELRLSTFPTTAAAPCADWFSVEPMGYQLIIADNGAERLIHRDGALPRSRGCPVTYRLYGVVLPFNAGSIRDAVALISVYPSGFEGPDRRFIAVPLGL
jgi:predicted secreted protein